MAKTKFSTFRIVFIIFSVVSYINSLDQSLFTPVIKNESNSVQYLINSDSGKMNKEINASNFAQGPIKFNTPDRGGSERKFQNFHTQRTETRFNSMHQGKSSFQSESQFPVVQQVQWKRRVLVREPASAASFFKDDKDEPKYIQAMAASLNKNEQTNTETFQDYLNNEAKVQTRTFQASKSHKEQKNIDFLQNVGHGTNFSFGLIGLHDVNLPFLVAPDDSGDSITGIQHFFRKEDLSKFRDQGKELISSTDRKLLFTENSPFLGNAENSFSSEEFDESAEAKNGDGSIVATENKEKTKMHYSRKDEDTSGKSVKNLPMNSGASSNKVAQLSLWRMTTENLTQSRLHEILTNINLLSSGTLKNSSRLIQKIRPGMKGKPPQKWKVTLKSSHLIKIGSNLPGLANKTNFEENLNQRNRGVIVRNIMLGLGSGAEAPGSKVPQSSSKIGGIDTISVGKMNLNSQRSVTRNGHAMPTHNINETTRNNLKNQTLIFGVKSASSDNITENELGGVPMNADSQNNKSMKTALRKEILGFAPTSLNRSLKGEKNIFIHNINLGSKSSAMKNKNSIFESESVKRVGSRVDHDSVRRGFGRMNHEKTETKGGTIGINSIREATPPKKEIFTFDVVPKSNFDKEKNNVFLQNIKLGLRNSPTSGKKTIFGRSSKENGFTSDNSSSMDKRIGMLLKSIASSSSNSSRQVNFIHGSLFTRRSKEKERLHSGSSPIKAEATLSVHNIDLGSKIKNENLGGEDSSKTTTEQESLIGIQAVKQTTKNNFGQEKNNIGSKSAMFSDAKKATISANHMNSEIRPNLLVYNMHLGSGSSFMGSTASSLDTNEDSLTHRRVKGRPIKITNTVTDERKTQPSANVFVHSIKLGSDTSSMKGRDFMRGRNFSKGKNINDSMEGKTLQLDSVTSKNKDGVSVGKVEPGSVISSLKNTDSNLGSSTFIKGRKKETFSNSRFTPGSRLRENKTYIFVHSINLGLKASSIERKSSASVLESKGIVESSSDEKSNFERFSIKAKGMNQRRKKVGRGSGLISENPRIIVHDILGSTSRLTKRKKTSRNRQVIFKDERQLFATEISGAGQVTPEEFLRPKLQHQSIFNWNALSSGNILGGRIRSKEQVARPISRKKPHLRYIFSSNQMMRDDSNSPMIPDSTNEDDSNKFIGGHDVTERAQFMASTKHAMITTPTTTISTTVTPTTIITHAPIMDHTKYYSLPSNVCDKCRLVNGVGYREHPRDCQLYIQCYFLGRVIRSVARDCGLGQFWDQQALTCKPAHLVNCVTDRCRISEVRGYQNKNNCRAYWTCIGGKSFGRCCQPGHTYVEGNGCVQDNTCQQSCERNQFSPGNCPLKIVPGDDTVFQQDITGHGWKIQKCAPGTSFNISTCSCNAFSRQHPSLVKTCKPEIHLTFDGSDGAMFDSKNGIKNVNVTVQNGVAKFNGNSRLVLWRFANAYLGKKVFVRLRFIEKGNSGQTEAIVSNGDCGHHPSLFIAIERDTNQLHMGAVTDVDTSNVTIDYKTNGWKEVTYMFDGDHVTGSVNGKRKTGRIISGNIESRQCAMQIGAGYGMNHFHGEIDEISLYLCKPENI